MEKQGWTQLGQEPRYNQLTQKPEKKQLVQEEEQGQRRSEPALGATGSGAPSAFLGVAGLASGITGLAASP